MTIDFITALNFTQPDQQKNCFHKTGDLFGQFFTLNSSFQAAQINLKDKTITFINLRQSKGHIVGKIVSYFFILPLIIALAVKIILHCRYGSYQINSANLEKATVQKTDPTIHDKGLDLRPSLPPPVPAAGILIPEIPTPSPTHSAASIPIETGTLDPNPITILTPKDADQTTNQVAVSPLPIAVAVTAVATGPLSTEPSIAPTDKQVSISPTKDADQTTNQVVVSPLPVSIAVTAVATGSQSTEPSIAPTDKKVPVASSHADPLFYKPYYKTRISFSNPRASCGPNSFAVVLAHTGYSLENIKKQALEIPIENIEALKQELRSSIEEEPELIKRNRNLEKGILLIRRYQRDNLAQDPYATNPDLGIKPELITPTLSEERNRARLEFIRNNESQMEANKKRIAELIANRPLLEKRIQTQKKRPILIENINRAEKTLRILRGQEALPDTGYINHEEALALCKVFNAEHQAENESPYQDKERHFVYNSAARCREDVGALKLKQALYHSDWRVIRVGRVGNPGHWFTYIRNEGEETATLLDDWSTSDTVLSFKQIFDHWSRPETWDDEQLAFYPV